MAIGSGICFWMLPHPACSCTAKARSVVQTTLWLLQVVSRMGLDQGWRTYGTRVHNGTWNEFLCMRHSLLSQFLFLLLDQRPYTVKNMWINTQNWLCRDCISIIVANKWHCIETFLHKSGAVRKVDWIFITGAPAWRWLGEYVTLDKTFYNLLFKQE